jgi:hypothetical protein
MKPFTTFLLITCFPLFLFSQNFIRIRADYTIKEKANASASLSKGTAYYDKTMKKLVYDASFPEKETWVIKDTTVYKMVSGKLAEKKTAPFFAEFSIYNIVLNGNLANYGLKDTDYKISHIEREGDLIITTWTPDKRLSNILGNVVISTRNKVLEGIVMFNYKGEIVSKQNYKSYINVSGLNFPTEIIELIYSTEGIVYKQTLYKNIVINELVNEKMYNYPVNF